MAANKGLQFEWALLYYAKENISEEELNNNDKIIMNKAKQKMGTSVLQDAKKVIDEISSRLGNNNRDKVWRSFKKVSGGTPEPKADIYFKIGNTDYNCSVKYGPSYQ